METYSQKPITFMYFWLNCCDESHIERILVAVKDIDHLFSLAGKIIKADNLHLFLLSESTSPRKSKKRYRINGLYGGTNPGIVGVFLTEKKPKPQKHLKSVKRIIFYDAQN